MFLCYWLNRCIDENLPDLSTIPDFVPSRYGHCHISGSLNLIKIIFPYFFGHAILIYVDI